MQGHDDPLDLNHYYIWWHRYSSGFSFLLLFSFCEIVDNVNTDWGEFDDDKGFKAYFVIQSSVSFSKQASDRNLGLRPIIKVLIVLRIVNGLLVL